MKTQKPAPAKTATAPFQPNRSGIYAHALASALPDSNQARIAAELANDSTRTTEEAPKSNEEAGKD